MGTSSDLDSSQKVHEIWMLVLLDANAYRLVLNALETVHNDQ